MTDSVLTGVDAVFDALDQAAVELLARVKMPDRDKDGEIVPEISAADHVKVFDAVVEYAALRAKVEPPKKLAPTKFGSIHERFHGTAAADDGTPQRRSRRKSAPDPETAFNGGTSGSA